MTLITNVRNNIDSSFIAFMFPSYKLTSEETRSCSVPFSRVPQCWWIL